ncbi:MAG: 50S ribosomal protein L18 [Candidatus Colwellbacteria bacterium CG10_big_fil_rev_8_21_14_0_10_42_22]|uniref:Large ribosomal subunit protein uL18 n=1 Tax=Candidatus Colwellbacteria bacterium CG10_big_fil_rev_8_21_14_0_10_42_22 TaxID=1974540 RepID=A0A2H0VFB5_9BACT|nr:MAG: 50S ribosomal protein L18 [Candidatus Colwellbacteria bacterium CG10_big_fil_rev_8_21_14_0_10_42_22]
MKTTKKALNRNLRQKRVRAKISGIPERPRMSVFKSLKNMEVQLIDDTLGKTLVRASSKEIKSKGNKTAVAMELGKLIAKKAKENSISTVVFDRRHYKYHGRVKALADSAREGGLNF